MGESHLSFAADSTQARSEPGKQGRFPRRVIVNGRLRYLPQLGVLEAAVRIGVHTPQINQTRLRPRHYAALMDGVLNRWPRRGPRRLGQHLLVCNPNSPELRRLSGFVASRCRWDTYDPS